MATETQSTTRTLEIDGMNGDACVKRVTGALNEVKDITTQSVKVGCATIRANQAGCDAACAAVTQAGYTVQEGLPTGKDHSASCVNPKNQSQNKPGDQARTPSTNPAVGKGDCSKPACGTEAKPASFAQNADMTSTAAK